MKIRCHFYFVLIIFMIPIPEKIRAVEKINKEQLSCNLTIIPKPQKIEPIDGKGLNPDQLYAISIDDKLERPVMGEILSLLVNTGKNGEGVLTLKIETGNNIPESDEGYVLTISNGKAQLISRSKKGLFYGCQTLEQMLEEARDANKMLPACQITDYPAMSYRAVHFDVKHHLDHMNYYYESIDRLARYKINAIIFEFEDKLRYQQHPLIAAPQAISIDEMTALTKYARARNIEISPLVQGLGHATYILKHQQYAYLRENPNNRWAFCPLHEGTYQVLFDMYREAIEATPGSRYLHIGGDEVGHIGICPRCKPTADKEGLLSLNLYWLKRVCAFAEENGRIPIFWDDMPLKQAGVYESTDSANMSATEVNQIWNNGREILEQVISEFPEKCVYMRWNYSMGSQPGNVKALYWYQNHDLDVMIATAAQSGPASLFPFDQHDKGPTSIGTTAIANFIKLADERDIDGMLCTAWDDRSPHMETYWRGFITSAEFSWSPNNRTLDELDKAYLAKEYGISFPGKYVDLYRDLRKSADFWERAFNRTSSRLDIDNALLVLPGIAHFLPQNSADNSKDFKPDFSKKLIELPNPDNPGAWSKKYHERLSKAKDIINEYEDIAKTLKLFHQNSTRNRYHWEVFIALNNFQITAPKLLLALENCDSGKTNQKKCVQEVKNALAEFDTAWQQLKSVYSKTRLIKYPENYVPDRYFHFASQREDLTWMIQVEEIFHKMVNEWLIDNYQTQ